MDVGAMDVVNTVDLLTFKQWISGVETKNIGHTFHCFLMFCKNQVVGYFTQ